MRKLIIAIVLCLVFMTTEIVGKKDLSVNFSTKYTMSIIFIILF